MSRRTRVDTCVEHHVQPHEARWVPVRYLASLAIATLGLLSAGNAGATSLTAGAVSANIYAGQSVIINVIPYAQPAGTTIDPLSLKIVTPPAHGTATVINATVLYKATLGFSGTDQFTYTVADTAKNVSAPGTTTITVAQPATVYSPVNLGASANTTAIASSGHPAAKGGLDGHGYAYAATNLGSTVTWSGETFKLGAADAASAVKGNGVPFGTGVSVAECSLVVECPDEGALQPSRFSALRLLATGVNGAQQNQQICMLYDDGYRETPSEECVTVSLSDWRVPQHLAGESIAATVANRVTPTGTLQAGPWYVYGYTLPLDQSRTLVGITVPSNPNVAILAMNLDPVANPMLQPVFLVNSVNIAAVTDGPELPAPGQPATGLDGQGNTYASELLGPYTVVGGIPFQIVNIGEISGYTGLYRASAAPGAQMNNTDYYYGYYSQLYLLGTGFYGDQVNQPVVVTYTDGTKTTASLSFSDWRTPAHYPGETVAITSSYRFSARTGSKQPGPWYVYSYSMALDKTKQVASFTLPKSDVVVLGATLVP